jgi:hypothetical protein
LYIAFLETLDLDHTVAQIDVVHALVKRYKRDALRALVKWVETHDAQLLADALA